MDDQDSKREPYEAPAVEDLPLVPEETVLAGCKTGTNAPGSSFRNHFCSLCVTNATS